MYIAFLAILLMFALVPTVDALIDKKKNKGKIEDYTEKKRLKGYMQSLGFLWGGALIVLAMCLIGGINQNDVGFRAFYFQYNKRVTVAILVLFGLAYAFFIYQTILPLISAKQRDAAKKQLADEKRAGAVKLLPRTKKEKLVFSFLSFSAGFCEEIIYRGFTLYLLQTIFPAIPVYLIILIPGIVFGIGHFYQGVQGVVMTGFTGAAFMCLYLVSGSLIPCIALHFLVDFSSAFLLSDE